MRRRTSSITLVPGGLYWAIASMLMLGWMAFGNHTDWRMPMAALCFGGCAEAARFDNIDRRLRALEDKQTLTP
jgi:hypothetical protein